MLTVRYSFCSNSFTLVGIIEGCFQYTAYKTYRIEPPASIRRLSRISSATAKLLPYHHSSPGLGHNTNDPSWISPSRKKPRGTHQNLPRPANTRAPNPQVLSTPAAGRQPPFLLHAPSQATPCFQHSFTTPALFLSKTILRLPKTYLIPTGRARSL